MITLVTIFNTISWNSWSTLEMVFALTQVAARPIRMENTRALMTLMMAGISSWKIASGTSFRPSTVETMFRPGMMAKPAPMEKRAAPREET